MIIKSKKYPLVNNDTNIDKKSIIYLENNIFNFLVLNIEPLDNEDREEQIYAELENQIDNFSKKDYIVNYEIIDKNSISEIIMVCYTSEKEIINISNENYIRKGKVKAIIPSFFICRNSNLKNYINIDFSTEYIVISKYIEKKLVEIKKIEIEDTVGKVAEFIKESYRDNFLLLTGNEDFTKEIYKRLAQIFKNDILIYKTSEIAFNRGTNFLPSRYISRFDKILYEQRFLMFVFLLVFLIFVSFFYLKKIQIEEREKLDIIERKNSKIAREIKEKRDRLNEANKQLVNLNKISTKKDKLYELIEELYINFPNNAYIESIKYDENINSLIVDGIFTDAKDSEILLSNLKKSEKFKVADYENIYLNKTDEKRNFKFKILLRLINKEV